MTVTKTEIVYLSENCTSSVDPDLYDKGSSTEHNFSQLSDWHFSVNVSLTIAKKVTSFIDVHDFLGTGYTLFLCLKQVCVSVENYLKHFYFYFLNNNK